MPYHMGYAGGFGWLIGLLFLIGLVLVIVWLVNTLSRGDRVTGRGDAGVIPPPGPARPTPNEILRERLARGEISAEEFERTRQVLGPDK